MTKRTRSQVSLLAFTLSLVVTGVGFCFQLTPIVEDFAPSGPDATQTFRVSNTTEQRIAVRVDMLTREMLPDGSEENASASDLFSLFPPRMVLNPGETQALRVRWLGPEAVNTERAFRLRAEQVPVDFGNEEEQGGRLRILFRYMASVYVVPPDPNPDVRLTGVERTENSDGIEGLDLRFENEGNAHTLLHNLSIRLEPRDTEAEAAVLQGDDLEGLAEENILAGAERSFFLPIPAPLRDAELQVEFSYEELR
jgi:fimbrial chaperone protein